MPVSIMPLEGHHQRKLIKIVMTEGYRVRATTIEGQNAFASMAFGKFHLTDGQNTRDQITSDRRSKRA